MQEWRSVVRNANRSFESSGTHIAVISGICFSGSVDWSPALIAVKLNHGIAVECVWKIFASAQDLILVMDTKLVIYDFHPSW